MRRFIYTAIFLLCSIPLCAGPIVFTPLSGNSYGGGFYFPIGQQYSIGLGLRVNASTAQTTANGYIGFDGIPIMGGIEADLYFADNKIDYACIGKIFSYPLTRELSLGWWITFVKYQFNGAERETLSLLSDTTPMLFAELKF